MPGKIVIFIGIHPYIYIYILAVNNSVSGFSSDAAACAGSSISLVYSVSGFSSDAIACAGSSISLVYLSDSVICG